MSINLRPTGEVVAFPVHPAEHVEVAQAQLRNLFAALAARMGEQKARALFTQVTCAELARQSHDTGNLCAARFAVEVLLDQAFAALAADPLQGGLGYAG